MEFLELILMVVFLLVFLLNVGALFLPTVHYKLLSKAISKTYISAPLSVVIFFLGMFVAFIPSVKVAPYLQETIASETGYKVIMFTILLVVHAAFLGLSYLISIVFRKK